MQMKKLVQIREIAPPVRYRSGRGERKILSNQSNLWQKQKN